MPEFTSKISRLAQAILAGEQIDRDEALYLLRLEGKAEDRYELFYWANRIRLRFLGPGISLCSIASVHTGSCSEDCRFCSQSAHYQTHVDTQQLGNEELLAAAERAAAAGAHCFGLVSSGRKPTRENVDQLAPVIEQIARSGKMGCCASLGCINEDLARRLRELGVRRYNHNLETSRRFFPRW